MLGYVDEHFAQDPLEMSAMAELFGTIASKLKHMPQPLLAYKIGIYQHINNTPTNISQGKKTVVAKAPTVTTTQPSVPKEEKIPANSSIPVAPKKPKTKPVSQGTISHEQLKEALIREVEISAKSLVEKYVVIQELTEHAVTLLAINKMAEISLNKNKE
jgi:hypothetical protein